jgi:hypothetical protein
MQAPTAMRSVSQAFNLATTAGSQAFLIPLIFVVNSNPSKRSVSWVVNQLWLIMNDLMQIVYG